MAHYKINGPSEREDNRGGRKNNTKALSLDETRLIKRFILNYAEANGVSLPGRVPGFHRDDILLLPACLPKSKVHRDYLTSTDQYNQTRAAQDPGNYFDISEALKQNFLL
jgi:hypothetical protein